VTVTACDVALPNGSPSDCPDSPPASTRARASVNVTDGDGKGWAGGLLHQVVDDAQEWWVLVERPPSLRELWQTRMPDRLRVPGDSGILYGGWVVWNHLRLIPAALAFALLVLSTHPARGINAAVMITALIAMIMN
jgi:hypothetical protein